MNRFTPVDNGLRRSADAQTIASPGVSVACGRSRVYQEGPLSQICKYLKDEQGIETLEWIAIGVLILGVAFAVYPGSLQTGLTTVVGNVTTALTGVTLTPAP